jgi:hypothetical protein
MPREIADWNIVNWRKVYRRSRRPIELRGVSSPYITIRAVGLLIILSCALIMPGTQVSWDWSSIFISLAVFLWLGWVLWPIVENQWASRLVFKARIERQLEAQFWQREMRPVIIDIQKAFRITSQGNLVEASSWIGHCRVSIPAWLLHIIEKQDEVDLLCLSTRRILGTIDQFSKP